MLFKEDAVDLLHNGVLGILSRFIKARGNAISSFSKK